MATVVSMISLVVCAHVCAQGVRPPHPIRFAILADRTGGQRPGVFPRIIEQVDLLQPDFVVCVGDMIEGYSEDHATVTNQQAQLDAELARLSMPFRRLPGNHDISNPAMLPWWAQRYGPRYYDFMVDDVLCLMLSTEEWHMPGGFETQAVYACAVLASNPTPRCTLVFMHKPVWLDEKVPAWWQAIESALSNRPHAVFAGHVHTYQKYERNGAAYYTLATSGGSSGLDGVYAGTFDHFTWVTLGTGAPVVANIRVDGVVRDDVITEESAAHAAQLRTRGIDLQPLLLTSPVFRTGALTLALSNCLAVPVTLAAPVQISDNAVVAPTNILVALAPGAVRTIPLTVRTRRPTDADPACVVTVPWQATMRPPGRRAMHTQGVQRAGVARVQTCPRIVRAGHGIAVDGRLDDWADMPFITGVTAKADCAYRFATAHDNRNIYVLVDITDDRRVARHDVEPWKQDGVEIRVMGEAWQKNVPHDARPGEVLCALSPGRGTNDMVWYAREDAPVGVQAICLATRRGYVAEIAVPHALLDAGGGTAWRAVRLNITVNDADKSDGPRVAYWWRPDWRWRESYRGAGVFRRAGE
jgi:hypothetical protein